MTQLRYYDVSDTIKRIEDVRRLAESRGWSVNVALDYLIDELKVKTVDKEYVKKMITRRVYEYDVS